MGNYWRLRLITGWFPYPFNYYRPGFGYYHGGIFSSAHRLDLYPRRR